MWRVWGVGNAILAGDALMRWRSESCATYLPAAVAHEAIGRLTAASLELCRGQQEDCAFEQRSQVTLDEYLSMAVAKTAALMGCACAVGALVPVPTRARYRRWTGSAANSVLCFSSWTTLSASGVIRR